MRRVLAAEPAVFLLLYPAGLKSPILSSGVVPPGAGFALQRNLISRHAVSLRKGGEKMEPMTRIELVTSSLPRTRSYQLSYVGQDLERETGLEPATNSLEGCDSTN